MPQVIMRSTLLLTFLTFMVKASRTTPEQSASPVLNAPTVSYVNLINDVNFLDSGSNDVLKRAMTEEGLVAIADIPGFAELRSEVLLSSYECGKQSSEARTTVFEDGTSRRTIAATASGVEKLNTIEFGTTTGDICSDAFNTKAEIFRTIVSTAAKFFTQRVGQLFSTAQGDPLLWHFDHTRSFDTMEDIVSNAEHLEHFHTYYKPTPASSEDTTTATTSTTTSNTESSTIDLHADQGMFIAFTPAILVEDSEGKDSSAHVTSLEAGQFYIQLRDGSTVTMDFGSKGNVLVFMLGDGVDQYFNNKLTQGPYLRSAPHGMVMPTHTETQARVWYGRMFLPPMDALSESHGISFGELRKRMIEDVHAGGGKGQGMGCSRALLETEGLQCADNQIYCWMRCMEYTEHANPETCDEQNLGLNCANEVGQVWHLNNSHGDYNPKCTNHTHETNPVTPIPRMPDRPASCETEDFAAYAGADNYQYSQALGFMGEAILMWNITADQKVEMKMAVSHVVGYLAFGPEAPPGTGGAHPGMNGAPIILGCYDPDPNVFGMGQLAPYIGTSVREYVISVEVSAFRHWSEGAETQSATQAAIDVTQCFTSMTFTTDAIAGTPLNLTGTQNMIWAFHKDTFLKGYHGYTSKGHLADFSFIQETEVTQTPPGPSSPTAAPTSGASSLMFGSSVNAMVAAFVLVVINHFMM